MHYLLSVEQGGKEEESGEVEEERRGQIVKRAELTGKRRGKEKENEVKRETGGTARSEIATKKKPRF